MANTVQVIINGVTETLTLNELTGKYEKTINAPNASSYNVNNDHYFPVQVVATDEAGNSSSADSSHSTFGNTLKLYVSEKNKPTIQILTPTSGAHTNNAQPTITFTLLDNTLQNGKDSGVNTSTCVIKIDGTAIGATPTFTQITGGYSGSVQVPSALTSAQHTITIDVDDFDGNHADTASRQFVCDLVAPTLSISGLTDNAVTNADSVSFTFVTNDLQSMPVTIGVTQNGTALNSPTVDQNGEGGGTITLLKNQLNTIVFTATDAAGQSTSVTYRITHDDVAPVIKSIVISKQNLEAGEAFTISVEVE